MQDTLDKVYKKTKNVFNNFFATNLDINNKKYATEDEVSGLRETFGINEVLPYELHDEKTDLFYTDDSLAFCLEVQPQSGADDSIITRLNTMYSVIEKNYGMQWCMIGSSSMEDDFNDYVDIRSKVENSSSGDLFVQLAKQKVNYIKKSKGKPLFTGSNYSIKKNILLLSFSIKGNIYDREKVENVINLRENIISNLKSAQFNSIHLKPIGLVRILSMLINPNSMFHEDVVLGNIKFDMGKLIKNQILDFGSVATVNSKEIVFGELAENIDDEYSLEKDERISARTLGMKKYPKYKVLWQMEKAIGDFFNNTLQYPCPYIITMGAYFIDRNEAENKVMVKYTRSKENARSPMAKWQPELAEQAKDWAYVHKALEAGGTICEVYHTVTLFAPRNKLNQYEQVVANLWSSMGFRLCGLETIQMPAFYSSLPLTFNGDLRDDLKKLGLISTKTTVNAVDMSPIIGEWNGLGQDKVLCYFGRKGNPVFLDLFANTAGNYNLFVTGASGSGKSVLLGDLIMAYRGVNAQAYVIDNGRSFRNIVERSGGIFLDFDGRKPICINPFSWITGAEDFEKELEMLVPIYSRMASSDEPLRPYPKALLREAISSAYYASVNGMEVVQDNGEIIKYQPERADVDVVINMLKLMRDEKGNYDREAFRLAKQLSPYSSTGNYGKFFNGEANLELDGDMVGLELEELNSFKDLRKVVVLTLIMRITAQMYLSRTRKKIMVIDEAWDLLGDDDDAANFIEEGYRRVRKYGGIFCIGTQSIQDAALNKAAAAAFANADWKMFLRQDLDKLEQAKKESIIALDDTKFKYLESLQTIQERYAEVLITSPMGMNIVRHVADPYSLLLSASNALVYNEVQELRDEGVDTKDILNIMAQRRGMEVIE